jgi:hypothetical protein
VLDCAPIMPPITLPLFPARGRKAIYVALAICTLTACIRFRNDAPADAGHDSGGGGGAPDGEGDASIPSEGGDAVVVPPPVCDKFGANVAGTIAADLITELVNDCTLRRYFANLPPIALTHLQECLTAQIGQVMGCRQSDGQPVKYPTVDSNGKFCRDMKNSHAGLSLSDGDFDAFIADFNKVLDHLDFSDDDKMRVLGVFGATRNDIVRFKDAGPTAPCDAPDAN